MTFIGKWRGFPGGIWLGYAGVWGCSDGLGLHQLRHSAATHLGDQEGPLQLIMAKTRHKSPRTARRYVKPGDAAIAEVTSLLGPPRRSH